MACAYFFFDGRDGQTGLRTVESLIRSLIGQISTSYKGLPATLTKLYHSCLDGDSQPSVKSLQDALFLILEAFSDVYIILDALDECAEREDLLKWITEMISWRKGKLHLLATTRPEDDISKHLRFLDPNHVCVKSDLVACDVARYIDHVLETEKLWTNEVKATIKSTLLENTKGMYV